MRLKSSLLLPLLFLAAESRASNAPYFFSTSARPGDGITVFLRRYALDEADCNTRKFLELNNLKPDAPLFTGRSYKLPVMIYSYNGQSIRSTLGISDLDKAKRIAAYNHMLVSKKLRQSDYQSSGILWVPYHELDCGDAVTSEAATAASTPEVKTVSRTTTANAEMIDIFGPEYSRVVRKSDKLKGKVYYISSGHGGPDPGAVAKMGSRNICEDEYAYDVGLRLARNLIENGATVHIVVQDDDDGIRNDDILVCDNDEKTMGTQTMPINQLARLRQRTDAINNIYARHARAGVKEQYLVCIHVDSRSANHRQDVFFYHFEHSKSGKKLAHKMQDVFQEKYARYRAGGQYEGTVSTRNLYMLRMPYPTTLYVELANIKNEYDRKRILPATNRQALANWLYEGLERS